MSEKPLAKLALPRGVTFARGLTSRGSAIAQFSNEHDLLVEPLEVKPLIERDKRGRTVISD